MLRDGKEPKAIGIIHCVGSRDENTNKYCSRVCCMYSLKLAHLIKEHTDAEVYNFYIDMRTPGKGYEEFYDRLLQEGVQFIRGRVAEVTDWALTQEEEGKLVIRGEDTLAGFVRRIPVDMVVLSQGLEAQADAQDGAPPVQHQLRRRGLLPGAASEARAGRHLHRRHLHRRLLPGAQGHSRHGGPGGRGGGAGAGPDRCRRDRAGTEHGLHRRRGLLGLQVVHPALPVHRDHLRRREEKKAIINAALCKGCGTCVAACPSGSIRQNLFEFAMC